MEIAKKYLLIGAGVVGLFANTGQDARAAFELNFLPAIEGPTDPNHVRTYARCNIPGAPDVFCQHADSAGDPDKTPFLRELVLINSVPYLHMIVGSLTPNNSGEIFAQETYVRVTTLVSNGASLAINYSASGGKPGCEGSLSVCSQGNISLLSGNAQVAGFGLVGTPLAGNQALTGNGSGDPTRAIIRQVISSSGMEQEFLKKDFLLKPKITQNITTLGNDGIRSEFILDMSAIAYNSSTAGTITNKLTLNDPALPVGSNFFDAVVSAQSSRVTGGQYTYTPGIGAGGWIDPIVTNTDNTWSHDPGTFAYSDGGSADLTNKDWTVYRNPFENP